MATQPVAHRFTVEEYEAMGTAGIFGEDDRVELVDGRIVEMTPIGSRHAACVDRLTRLFTSALGERAIVRVQNPAIVDPHSEPQPDLSLLVPRADFYAGGHPRPAEMLLVVEVADTSLRYERGVKRPLYAAAGIREFWLVDLEASAVEVHRGPSGSEFTEQTVVGPDAMITLLEFPDVTVAVSAIFG